jgi:multidrug efflux pump subunit AcrA (membrane-fusion protein)
MKLRHTLLPLAAVAGLGIAIVAVVQGERAGQASPSGSKGGEPASPGEAQAPFAHEVAGTGVVEAGSGNIAIGTPVSGIVAAVPVRWDQAINKGDTLFQLDDRELRAELPLMAARVNEAQARLDQARYQLRLADEVHAQRLLSEEQYRDRRWWSETTRVYACVSTSTNTTPTVSTRPHLRSRWSAAGQTSTLPCISRASSLTSCRGDR